MSEFFTGSVLMHRTSDVDEHAASLADWEMSYDQLGRGIFEGQFTDIRVPGIQMFFEKTNCPVRQQGKLTRNSVGFAFMMSGQGPGAFNGLQFETDSLLACNGSDIDLRTPAQCQMAGLVLDGELLEEALQSRNNSFSLPENSAANLALKGPSAEHLRQVIHDTLELARGQYAPRYDGAVAAMHWREDLLDALVGVIESTQSMGDVRRANERTRLVNHACQLMLSSALEGVSQSLGEVCRTVGVSPRKLGYCFQDMLGMSALEYLKAVRLNSVRRELRRAECSDTSIYDVATRHGFWHFGRFSVEYRQHFGERPTDTLRQKWVKTRS
jgi:AraC family ethanolamine operon transcriptional activator